MSTEKLEPIYVDRTVKSITITVWKQSFYMSVSRDQMGLDILVVVETIFFKVNVLLGEILNGILQIPFIPLYHQ